MCWASARVPVVLSVVAEAGAAEAGAAAPTAVPTAATPAAAVADSAMNFLRLKSAIWAARPFASDVVHTRCAHDTGRGASLRSSGR